MNRDHRYHLPAIDRQSILAEPEPCHVTPVCDHGTHVVYLNVARFK